MATQTWIYLLIIYFVSLSIMIGTIGQGGMLVDSDVSITTNPSITSYSVNQTNVPEPTALGSTGFLKSVWDFAFNWNIDMGVGAWVWVIRAIFVYLPVLFTILAVIFALPFMGGH